jgi:hypothetical protein
MSTSETGPDGVDAIPCDPKDPDDEHRCNRYCKLHGYLGGHCARVNKEDICVCEF